MKTRAAGALLLGLTMLTACTPDDNGYEYREPEYYGLDLLFCEQEVAPTESCTEVVSGSGATIFANVLANKAGGHVIQVEINGPVLGTVKKEELYVNRADTYSQWYELSRDVSCRELPCEITITVYVDYEPILTESISFV